MRTLRHLALLLAACILAAGNPTALFADTLASAEAFLDDPALAPGAGTSLGLDGGINNAFRVAAGALDFTGVAPGSHTLYLRFQDATGTWSAPVGQGLYVTPGYPSTPLPSGLNRIEAAEAFIDADPGEGGGVSLDVAVDGAIDSSTEVLRGVMDLYGLGLGVHVLHIRYLDSTGIWSPTTKQSFYVPAAISGPGTGNPSNLVAAVGRIDEGPSIALTADDGAFDDIVETVTLSEPVSNAYHNATIQFLDTEGTWSTGENTEPTFASVAGLSGRVTDAGTGLPVAGVQVWVGGGHGGLSDSNGFYTVGPLPYGSAPIATYKSGYLLYNTTVDFTGPTRLDIALSQNFASCATTGILYGTVRDGASNQGLPGITVNLGVLSTTTNAAGGYTFSDVPAGVQNVSVSPSGYLNYAQPVSMCGNTVQNIPLTKPAATIDPTYGSGWSADPVNTATGNYTFQRSDLKLPGIGFDFSFERGYNSQNPVDGPLGYGWTHNFNTSLGDTGIAIISWGDGSTQTFAPDGAGGYAPQPGVFDTLTHEADGSWTLKKKNGSHYSFDTAGALQSISDRNGNTQSLTYTSGLLTRITDTAGRAIDFVYDASGRIEEIQDPLSRTIRFTYDAAGDLVISTDPRGGATYYTYDADHQMLTATDPRNNVFVQNTYDAVKRVVTSQRDAKNSPTTYVYDELTRTTTITDPLNSVTVHYHDENMRLIREEDALGNSSVYIYDAAGNRTDVMDKNGNLTRYGYDWRGNVTSKLDALGNLTAITYDAQNNPLSRADALGNVTQFQYDANGNLTQTTDAMGHIASVTYTPTGLPLTLIDLLGNVTTHAYDVEGNRTQTTDALSNSTTYTYDGVGRRLSITDPLGRIITYSYDANDNPLTITDPLENVTTHAYDGNNNRISTLDRDGNFTSFSYDEKDLLTTTTDALGNIMTNTYDSLDRRTEVSDANGNVTQSAYDAVGNQIQMTDALGHTTQYTYDPNGNRLSSTNARAHTMTSQYDALNRRTQVTDPLGQSTTTTYDELGRVTTVTSAAGQVTTNSYDALGRLVQVTNALGDLTQHTYDANGNRVTTTDLRGNSTTYGYDANNRRITVTDALENVSTTVYDAVGQVASVTDQRGNTSTSTYDAAGRLTQVTDALGNITQYSYDAIGNRLTVTDPLGRVITTAYDPLNRVASITDAATDASTFTYDAVGNKLSETDRNGNTTQYGYDAVNRIVQITNALGLSTQVAYDAVGNRISLTDPLGHVTAYGYDANNRHIIETDPLGNVSTTAYDPVGRITASTDANGQITSFAYDLLNRLEEVTDAQGGVVTYTYDANGNRLSMTDPNGNTTSYTYDVLSRRTTTTEALGNITTLQYDEAGNITRRTDARGQITQYAYDSLNRLVTTTYPGLETVAFIYDAVGNRTQMTDSLGATSTVYDVRNRVTQVTDPFGMTVQYGYDSNGNRTSLTYPGNKTVTYDYDAHNRLTKVTDWLTQATSYQYDAADRLILTTQPNGTTASYGYDNADRLTSLANRQSDNTVISSYAYTLDGVGNHLSEDRLEAINPSLIAEEQLHTYDAENRLTETNAIANTFDANGSLTAKGINGYVYDEENRLTQTTIGATTTQYEYDGLGNRYSRTRAGNTTRYVLDTNTALTNVLAETDALGTVQSYSVYGLGLVARIQLDNTTHYYHFDSRGSTVALTNAAEVVTDSYAYDPFGKPIATTGANTNPFRYLGHHGVQDEGDDLNYIRARYYDTEQQRFVSKDSKPGQDRMSQTLNRYAFANNSPVILVDIDGFSVREGRVDINTATPSDEDGFHRSLLIGTSLAYIDLSTANSTPNAADLSWTCEPAWWDLTANGCYSGPDWSMGLPMSAPGGLTPREIADIYRLSPPKDKWDMGAFFHDFAYANADASGTSYREKNMTKAGADAALLAHWKSVGITPKNTNIKGVIHYDAIALQYGWRVWSETTWDIGDSYVDAVYGYVDISTSAVETMGGAYVNAIEWYVDTSTKAVENAGGAYVNVIESYVNAVNDLFSISD